MFYGLWLQDPGIKAMAEKLAQDPAFAQMTQSLQSGMGGMGGRAPSASPGPSGMDPNVAAEAMQGMFQNPEFMTMAQDLGQKIMQVSTPQQSPPRLTSVLLACESQACARANMVMLSCCRA